MKTKQKNGRKLPKRRTTVIATVPGIPIEVHNKVKRFRLKIIGERQRNYVLMEAYAEFLKELAKDYQI